MATAHPSRPALRVLFVQGHLRENGGLRVVNALAGRFTADGVRTAVFALEEVEDEAVALPDEGVVLRYGAPASLPAARRLPSGLLALLRTARRYDVVVSGSEIGHGLLAAALVARTLGKPFVVLAQGDLDAAIRAWVPAKLQGATRWAHRHADAVIAVSPGLVPGLLANGLPADRVHVVVNGVDVDELQERAVTGRRAPHPADPRPQVLAIGRLTSHKGFDLLVRASAAVRARGLAHDLVIAGEGPDRASLEQLATELDADHVSLPGFVDNPAALLAQADLFVSSSRTEAMPLTLLESLALAVPVVATDCCEGSRLLLDDGRYGDLVAPESVDALTEAIAAHLGDQRRLRHAAAAGPAFARRFEPRRLAREHLALLARIAGRGLPEFAPLPVPVGSDLLRTHEGPTLGSTA